MDERLIAKADYFFADKFVDCSLKSDIKKVLDSGKVARFSFCSCDKNGEGCAGFIEKELSVRVMGARGDVSEKASGKCPICEKRNSVVVYAGSHIN